MSPLKTRRNLSRAGEDFPAVGWRKTRRFAWRAELGRRSEEQ